jgi:chromate transporter
MNSTPQPISFWTAFQYWLKLGFISFGGPAGQIAMMHSELVEKRRWISEQRFLHALNYCMVLPGPEAAQLAIYIGWLLHRTWGGVVAGVLFILPSLLLLISLSWAYMALNSSFIVAGFLYGIKPAVVAIVLAAAWRIGSRTLKTATLIAIALAAFVSIAFLHLPFPLIVVGAALIGVLVGRFKPSLFKTAGGHGSSKASYGAAIIDDDTPTPAHALFSWIKLIRVVCIGIVLAGIAAAVLWANFGGDAVPTQMALFFSKAAMLTFGGAYAVLPYVYQSAVHQFQWLSGAQMMDGLALGETTPGPLIMIVTFVGFVGGWNDAIYDPYATLHVALLCAAVATFFTFLPSFIFILAGAPFVESTRNNLKLTMPLTAISAAVVGVILSLALFFAQHVFIKASGSADWMAIALTAVACIAVFRFKINTILLIVLAGVVGVKLRFFGLA